VGQLLVVLPVKQKLALPELIPDPLCHHKHCSCGTKKVSRAMDLGSVGNRKRPMRNASTFLLIPDPLLDLKVASNSGDTT